MKRVLLRISQGAYEKVVRRARRSHRSVNAEMVRALTAWGDVGLKDDSIEARSDIGFEGNAVGGSDSPEQAECAYCGRTTNAPDGCGGCGAPLCPRCLLVGICLACQVKEVPF